MPSFNKLFFLFMISNFHFFIYKGRYPFSFNSFSNILNTVWADISNSASLFKISIIVTNNKNIRFVLIQDEIFHHTSINSALALLRVKCNDTHYGITSKLTITVKPIDGFYLNRNSIFVISAIAIVAFLSCVIFALFAMDLIYLPNLTGFIHNTVAEADTISPLIQQSLVTTVTNTTVVPTVVPTVVDNVVNTKPNIFTWIINLVYNTNVPNPSVLPIVYGKLFSIDAPVFTEVTTYVTRTEFVDQFIFLYNRALAADIADQYTSFLKLALQDNPNHVLHDIVNRYM